METSEILEWVDKKGNPKCSYPGCKHAPDTAFDVKLTDEKDAAVRLPLCFYHFYIVMGGHFTAIKSEEQDFKMQGPFKLVEIIEQVMSAREMISQFKKAKDIPSEEKKP